MGFAQRLFRTASERLGSTRVSACSGQALRVAAGGNGYVSPGRYNRLAREGAHDLHQRRAECASIEINPLAWEVGFLEYPIIL